MAQEFYIDDDHDLQDRIHGVLARNPHFLGHAVGFKMEATSVVLRGTVRSYYHKQVAQESLRSIKGIRQIRNELQVIS